MLLPKEVGDQTILLRRINVKVRPTHPELRRSFGAIGTPGLSLLIATPRHEAALSKALH